MGQSPVTSKNAAFTGAIPEHYERHLVPVIFQPYAIDIVSRIGARPGLRVLEIAAGTGAVTREMLARLPADATIVATDLNEAMLEEGKRRTPKDPRLEWHVADAQSLPFPDASFDVVLVQFGVMFVPDKPLAMREAHRVLKPGGRLVFSVWDSFAENPFGRLAYETVSSFFDSDPPTFYLVPFGWSDRAVIRETVSGAGFRDVRVEPLPKEARSTSAADFAKGLVRGNPASIAIQERGIDADAVERAVARELGKVGGAAPHVSPMQALVVEAAL